MGRFIVFKIDENTTIAILKDSIVSLIESDGFVRIDFNHPQGHLVRQEVRNSFNELISQLNDEVKPVSKICKSDINTSYKR